MTPGVSHDHTCLGSRHKGAAERCLPFFCSMPDVQSSIIVSVRKEQQAIPSLVNPNMAG